MPSNDLEVFEYLTSNPDTSLHVDYLTYAVFAHEKSEWINHFASRHGAAPAQAEIDDWISDLTDHQFDTMRSRAKNFFDEAAQTYLSEEVKRAREDALNSAIVSQVKAASSFWKQLAMALTTAIVAPLILGGIIALALLYDAYVPGVGDISNKLQQQVQPQPQQ